MTGAIRMWRLLPGDTLDRRRLRECFYEAADRLSQVYGSAFGDRVFGRNKFTLDSFEEYEASQEFGLNFRVPSYGHLAPGGLVTQVVRESIWDATLEWSLEGTVQATKGYLLLGVPVLDHEVIWGAQDFVCADQILDTVAGGTDPDDVDATGGETGVAGNNFGLGGACHVHGTTARSSAGILLLSVAAFNITKSQLHLRKWV